MLKPKEKILIVVSRYKLKKKLQMELFIGNEYFIQWRDESNNGIKGYSANLHILSVMGLLRFY